MSLDLENVIEDIGGLGMYQKVILFCIGLIYLPLGHFIFAPVFAYLTPPHRCFIPAVDEGASNVTSNATLLEAFLPYANPEAVELARCSRYVTDAMPLTGFTNISLSTATPNNGPMAVRQTETCVDGWVFMDTEGRISASEDFDMVCENSWRKPLLTSGLIIGMFFGSTVAGPFADRFGRRIVTIVNLLLYSVLMGLFSFIPSYAILVVVIILAGASRIILYCSAFVLAQELVHKQHRAMVSCLLHMMYTVGYMMLPGVAYFIHDWRWIIRSVAFCCVVFIPYIWILPESPRWLLSKGRYNEAHKMMRTMARINKANKKMNDMGRALTDEKVVGEKPMQLNHGKANISIRGIFSNPVMRARCLVISCVWTVSLMSYYALAYNTSNLVGNPYWNCFATGAVDIPANLLSGISIQKLGRRPSLAGALGLTGLFCGLIPVFGGYGAVTVMFAMVGKFFATFGMCVLYLFTSELYPTLLRSTGLGISVMASRISSICAPFLVYAGENAGQYIPFYVMSALSVGTSLLCLLLPETKQSPLPNTMEEAVNLEQYRLLSFSCVGHNAPKRQPTRERSLKNSEWDGTECATGETDTLA